MDKFKKTGFVSLMALAFLLVASLTAFATGFIPCPEQSYGWAYICAGAFLLVISGVTAFVIRDKTAVNIACFAVNAVALGCCIRAWYIFRGLNNGFLTMFFVSLACIAYLWLFFALCLIPPLSRHIKLFFWLWLILSVIAYVLVVIFTKTTFVSTFGFYMLVMCGFIYSMVSPSADFEELMRALTLSAYSVFIVAIIVAVIAISGEGDFDLDFAADFSADFGSADTKKAKQIKQDNDKFLKS